MAKKGTTKTKKVVTDDMTATEVIENIINDATMETVQELVEKVENTIPTDNMTVFDEASNVEDIIPQLTEKMAELDDIKEAIETNKKEVTKKLTNSQVTYSWNGVSLFE